MPLSQSTLERIEKGEKENDNLKILSFGATADPNLKDLDIAEDLFISEMGTDENKEHHERNENAKRAFYYALQTERERLLSEERQAHDPDIPEVGAGAEVKTEPKPQPKPAEVRPMSNYGDNKQVLKDYQEGLPTGWRGQKTPRTLTENGGMEFNSKEELTKFMDYQAQQKREYAFSEDQGKSGKYQKYDRHIMGFNDGSKYQGHLNEIKERMERESKGLQKQVDQIKAELEDKPGDSKLKKQLGEQQKKLDNCKEKIKKVDSVMNLGGAYKLEENRPKKAVVSGQSLSAPAASQPAVKKRVEEAADSLSSEPTASGKEKPSQVDPNAERDDPLKLT